MQEAGIIELTLILKTNPIEMTNFSDNYTWPSSGTPQRCRLAILEIDWHCIGA